MGFAKTRHGMQDIDMKRKWDVGFLQKGAGMQDQDPPPPLPDPAHRQKLGKINHY